MCSVAHPCDIGKMFVPQVEDGWRRDSSASLRVSGETASAALRRARIHLSENRPQMAYDAIESLRQELGSDLRCRREVQDFALQLLTAQGRFVDCLAWTDDNNAGKPAGSWQQWYRSQEESCTIADGRTNNAAPLEEKSKQRSTSSCNMLSPMLSVTKQSKEYVMLSASDVLQRAAIWIGIFHQSRDGVVAEANCAVENICDAELSAVANVMVISSFAEVVSALRCREHRRCPVHWQTLGSIFAAMERLATSQDGSLAAAAVRDYIDNVIVKCLQLRDRPLESLHRSYLQSRAQLDVTMIERHRHDAFGVSLQHRCGQVQPASPDGLVDYLTTSIVDALPPLADTQQCSLPCCWPAVTQRIIALSPQSESQQPTTARDAVCLLLKGLFTDYFATRISSVFGQPQREGPTEAAENDI